MRNRLEWSKARLEGKIDWMPLGRLIILHDSISDILTGLFYEKMQSLKPFVKETKDRLYNEIREMYKNFEKEVANEEKHLKRRKKQNAI